MTTWTLTIPGRARTKNKKRAFMNKAKTKVNVVDNATAVAAEENARAIAWAARPPAPFAGPVVGEFTFVFKLPVADLARLAKGKAKAGMRPGDPCPRKIDRGNCLKLVEDALRGIVYVDDALICDGAVRKVWGLADETRIAITPHAEWSPSLPEMVAGAFAAAGYFAVDADSAVLAIVDMIARLHPSPPPPKPAPMIAPGLLW